MSWKVVDAKWQGFLAAFDGFDPAMVASYSPDKLDALTADPGIIRNRRKIEATVSNAQTLLALEREFGGFGTYLKSNGGDFDALVRDMRKRFKFVGTFGAYFFLYVVGEPVPSHEEFRARMAKI
jgi:3-methyladenine DNA glycosylase Tag